jgi:hypothetical protein
MLPEQDEILIALLNAYLDHELDEEKKQDLKERLKKDERARRLLLLLLRIRKGIEYYGIVQDTPTNGKDTDALREQLQKLHQEQILDFNPKKWISWAVTSIAATLLLLVIFYWNKPEEMTTPQIETLAVANDTTRQEVAKEEESTENKHLDSTKLLANEPAKEKKTIQKNKGKKTTPPPAPQEAIAEQPSAPVVKNVLSYKNTAGNIEFKGITDIENIFFTNYKMQVYVLYQDKFYAIQETNNQFVEAQEETNEQIIAYLLAQNKFQPYKKTTTNAPLPATKYPRIIEAMVLVNNTHKTYNNHYRIGVKGIELYGNFKKKEVQLIEASPEKFYLVIGNSIYEIEHSFDILPLPAEVPKEERKRLKKWFDEQH